MESAPQPKSFVKPWLTTVLLVVLFVAALGIRLYDLTDLPNDFYMVRQYHSLLIARGMYYAHLTSVPAWQRNMAVAQWKAEGLIEPPIMEALVALTYNLTGVQTWMGRLYASLFWLIGGIGDLAAGEGNVHACRRHHRRGIFPVRSICGDRQPGLPARSANGGYDRLVDLGALPLGEVPDLETGHPGRGTDRTDDLRQIGGCFSPAGRSRRIGDQPGLLETHFCR